MATRYRRANADAAELIGLCEELAAFPGTQVEFIPTMHPFSEAHIDLMTNMSVAARSPLNWNVLITLDAEECEGKLSASDHAAANGGRVVALSYPGPMQARVSLLSSAFDAIPGWSETMALPPGEIIRQLNDPVERERLRELAAKGDSATLGLTRFENLRVLDTYTDDTRAMEGRLLGDLARDAGPSRSTSSVTSRRPTSGPASTVHRSATTPPAGSCASKVGRTPV